MNPYIMLATAAILLIGAILRQIDWKKLAAKWVGRNAAHAMMYVETGGVVEPIPGERDRDNILVYNWKEGKIHKSVTLPANYPEEYLKLNGRRIIGVKDGIAVASPLGFMTLSERKKFIESEPEISVILHSQAVVKALRSINQSKPVNWMMIIIIGVVAIAGIYWYTNKNKQPPSNNNPVITQNQTVNMTGNNPPLILITPPPSRLIP